MTELIMIKIVDWSNNVNYEKVNGLYVIQNNVWIDFLYNSNKFRITVDAGNTVYQMQSTVILHNQKYSSLQFQ